jgi:hypothetical protein
LNQLNQKGYFGEHDYETIVSTIISSSITAATASIFEGSKAWQFEGGHLPYGVRTTAMAAAFPIAFRAIWEVRAFLSDKARAAFGWARDTVLEYPASSLSLAMGLTASVIAAVSGTPLLPVGLLAAGGTGAIILYTRGAEALANAAQNSWDNGYLGQGFTWTTTGWSEGHLAQGFTWATTGWSEGYLAECFDWAISEWDRGYLAKGYNAIEEGIANAWNGIAAAWSRLLAPRVVPPKATAYNPPGVPTKAAVQKLLRV